MTGKIILLNGPSSSGKSTLAALLHARVDGFFWRFSIDHLREAGVLPLERFRSGELDWAAQRPAFFDGFHRCLPELARAGNDVIVEHIVETPEWMARLVALLAGVEVFFVGLRCPVEELERRERARGDRRIGEARGDLGVHDHAVYDLELDSTQPAEANADAVLEAWRGRTGASAFETMRARLIAAS